MMYNDKVMDHFLNPRNVGEIADADGVGQVENPVCGDTMKMTIKVDPDDLRITDVRFMTLGCGAAIATSSISTEMIKGKTLQESLALTKMAIAEALGGLPESKMHCSNLAVDALRQAIGDYVSRHPEMADRIGCDSVPVESNEGRSADEQ